MPLACQSRPFQIMGCGTQGNGRHRRAHIVLFIVRCVVLGRGLCLTGVSVGPATSASPTPKLLTSHFNPWCGLPAPRDRGRSLHPGHSWRSAGGHPQTLKYARPLGDPGLASSGCLAGPFQPCTEESAFPQEGPAAGKWLCALRTQLGLPCLWALAAGNWPLVPVVS